MTEAPDRNTQYYWLFLSPLVPGPLAANRALRTPATCWASPAAAMFPEEESQEMRNIRVRGDGILYWAKKDTTG